MFLDAGWLGELFLDCQTCMQRLPSAAPGNINPLTKHLCPAPHRLTLPRPVAPHIDETVMRPDYEPPDDITRFAHDGQKSSPFSRHV